MLGHGYQILPEFVPAKVTESIKLEVNTTAYFNLTEPSNYDSIYGMWFYVEAFTGGIGNVTLTLQGAGNLNQSTWTDIGAGVAITGGTPAAPIQTAFQRAPLVSAAAAAFATLPPFLRFKLVTDVGATAAISKITRTIRGLA
jgi:hypothetical protein